MQRRATAVYVGLFLLIAVGSYAVIATAQEPTPTIEDARTLESGGQFSVGDRTYTVANVTAEGPTVVLAWTNESFVFTDTVEDNATVDLDGTTYRMLVPNASEPSSFTLREEPGSLGYEFRNGTQYVFYNATVDGNPATVEAPYSEYVANNDSLSNVTHSTDDRFDYAGNESEVTATRGAVTFSWVGEKRQTREIEDGGTGTLDGREFVVTVEGDAARIGFGNDTVEEYRDDVETNAQFRGRINGLWSTIVFSTLGAVMLTGLAYLPRRE